MPEKYKHKNDARVHNRLKNLSFEYLGSDGVKIQTAHDIYLKECLKFRTKAKQYKFDNEYLKKSLLPNEKPGYVGSEETELKILQERNEQWKQYYEMFDLTNFDSNKEAMYKCYKGKSKKIRIIRKIQQPNQMNFSEDVDKTTNRWFLRYGNLSRFIQAARKIMIINRLQKVLVKIKSSEITAELKHEKEEREQQEEIEKKYNQIYKGVPPCFRGPQKCCHTLSS